MEASEPYFWRIIIFPASDFIWVPLFFYITPIFSHHRHHAPPGSGLSRAGLSARGEGEMPGETGELGRQGAGQKESMGSKGS